MLCVELVMNWFHADGYWMGGRGGGRKKENAVGFMMICLLCSLQFEIEDSIRIDGSSKGNATLNASHWLTPCTITHSVHFAKESISIISIFDKVRPQQQNNSIFTDGLHYANMRFGLL